MIVFEAKMTVMLVSMLQNKNEISYQSRGCYPFIKYKCRRRNNAPHKYGRMVEHGWGIYAVNHRQVQRERSIRLTMSFFLREWMNE